MRFFIITWLAFALTACAMPDGRTYFLMTADDGESDSHCGCVQSRCSSML